MISASAQCESVKGSAGNRLDTLAQHYASKCLVGFLYSGMSHSERNGTVSFGVSERCWLFVRVRVHKRRREDVNLYMCPTLTSLQVEQ